MFAMLTGRRTTLRTDKCTDRIIRLCTSVALDGLNLTEKWVVCTVSILKHSDFPPFYLFIKKNPKHFAFITFIYVCIQNVHVGMFTQRQHVFP